METLIQNRTIKKGHYEFDEVNHVHTLDGKKLTGVTTVLAVIAKPALIQWSANMAVQYVSDHFPTAEELLSNPKAITELLAEAKYAHRKKKEEAGTAGTDVHSVIEGLVRSAIDYAGGYIHEATGSDTPQVKNFIDWAIKNHIRFLECELHVFNRRMWVGGILDLIYEQDGKLYIGDIKTSSGIYPEYFWQMGGYDICLSNRRKYKDIYGYTIINLRKDGSFEVQSNYGRKQNRKAFRSCLNIYRLLELTKKTI